MTRPALALFLIAAPALADIPTHQVIVTAPGVVLESEPMPHALCIERAAKLHGSVLPVPLGIGLVMVLLSAECVPAGLAS